MGFESCHPAVNFIFFTVVLYGTVSFTHPVFLAIAYCCAFAYSVRRGASAWLGRGSAEVSVRGMCFAAF